MKKFILFPLVLLLMFSCYDLLFSPEVEENNGPEDIIPSEKEQLSLFTPPKRISFDSFTRAIPIPEVTSELVAVYNDTASGDFIAEYTQEDMADTLDGYVTDNQAFFDNVLSPAIEPYLDSLKNLQKYEAINALTLFIYESYVDFFGNSFYRWGGDLTDRDQPQTEGSHSTSKNRYGMDCSGFGASPYEAAVLLELLDPTSNEGAFSWMGFKHICENNASISDGGGRGGTTNNFRLEVSDFPKIGELITTIAAGSTPSDEQLALMQAGDAVVKSGHMGLLLEINEELYFLESGGSTVNEEGLYTPYRAKEALADFASRRTTKILRCLPDKEATTGIVQY
ncbi:MAG: hypothetical protein WCT23_08115 [Candidatus Neomarinimicrobiota bacterium]